MRFVRFLAIVVFGPILAVIGALYVLICFPLFVFTTLCSLSITFTRVSLFLFWERLSRQKRLAVASAGDLEPQMLGAAQGLD